MSENRDLEGFLTDVRIALELNPMVDPNIVVRRACVAMAGHHIYDRSDCRRHVRGALVSKRPYAVLKPAIELHKQWVGV